MALVAIWSWARVPKVPGDCLTVLLKVSVYAGIGGWGSLAGGGGEGLPLQRECWDLSQQKSGIVVLGGGGTQDTMCFSILRDSDGEGNKSYGDFEGLNDSCCNVLSLSRLNDLTI